MDAKNRFQSDLTKFPFFFLSLLLLWCITPGDRVVLWWYETNVMSCLLELQYHTKKTRMNKQPYPQQTAEIRQSPLQPDKLQGISASYSLCLRFRLYAPVVLRLLLAGVTFSRIARTGTTGFSFSTFTHKKTAQFAHVFTAEIRKSAFLKWLATQLQT